MRDIVISKRICLLTKAPLFPSDFNETFIFGTDFRKNAQIENFIEIHPVGAGLFHANGRTDMKKLIVAFCNFAERFVGSVLRSVLSFRPIRTRYSDP